MKPVLHRDLKYARRLSELDSTLNARLDQAIPHIDAVTNDLQALLPIMSTATLAGIQDIRKEIITTPITITQGDITDLKADITRVKRTYNYKALRIDDSLKLLTSKCRGCSIVLREVRKLNDAYCRELLAMAKRQA